MAKTSYYITQTAKQRVGELKDLLVDMEESFPKAVKIDEEDYSNINKSLIDLVDCFCIDGINSKDEPVEVTQEQLLREGWELEQIHELEEEYYLEVIEDEQTDLDDLREEILEKGLVGRLNTKDGLIEKLVKVKDGYINGNYPDIPGHIAALIINISESTIFSKIEELEEWFLTKQHQDY